MLEKAGLSEENILQVKSAPQKAVILEEKMKKLKKNIKEKESELRKYADDLLDVQKVKTDYENVISDAIEPLVSMLEEQADENKERDIKNIGLRYSFNLEEAWENLSSEFCNYFDEIRTVERRDLAEDFISKYKYEFSQDLGEIQKTLSEEGTEAKYSKSLKEVFSEQMNFEIFRIIRDKHLNNVHMYKQIEVIYDGKPIERASFGQKCTAVIVILLLFGNYPLIIDEPETHLDSSLIANYLVPLIKNNKKNRQLIFATHNANFVVNGDSEKIFILNNDTGATEVTETTIEDIANRNELLKLEGGRKAFRKRGDKMNI